MKPTLILTCAASLAAIPFLINAAQPPGPAAGEKPAATSALKVHEWGTFTVLIGTDGVPVEWYQPASDLAELPPFVQRSFTFAGKFGTSRVAGRSGLASLRMETPVLYFYPEKQMEITVTADLPGGGISEVFPPVSAPLLLGPSATWHGVLLPPDSPDAALIPAAEGKSGRHYAAARAVPDAWLFRAIPKPPAKQEPNPFTKDKLTLNEDTQEAVRKGMLQVVAGKEGLDPVPAVVKAPEPVDNFIFYRGAGTASGLPLRANQAAESDAIVLTNSGKAPVPHYIALRVEKGQTAWTKGKALSQVEYVEGRVLHQQTVTFPAPAGTAAEVAAQLRKEMTGMLISEGLTKAEAEAMVATWDDLWFTEPGTRILAVLPQEIPDSMVPLKLSPAPREIDRVFVARLELISHHQENQLVHVLSQPVDTTEARKQLSALELGRFGSGALQRAVAIMDYRMKVRYSELSTPPQK